VDTVAVDDEEHRPIGGVQQAFEEVDKDLARGAALMHFEVEVAVGSHADTILMPKR
jgi:hypothetical protein